ncbi:MAG: hypothetical protein E7553_06650 [Ruminococcaceae bacterium]|nr:hypothetical protein [Oscillospiraceae bacterium]
MSDKQKVTPRSVWQEYENGRRFKSGLGTLGLYEQNRRNERFFVGDQWHGAKCGGERPLVRHNVIKRIGDYKIAVVGSAPLSVSYSAEGVANTAQLREKVRMHRQALFGGNSGDGAVADRTVEVDTVMAALSDYFRTTAERVKFEDCKAQVLEDAYIGGTGYLYTYWDNGVETGLYADAARTTPICGDILAQTLDVENVYMGDPNNADVQSQPYILIVQRKSVRELRQRARHNGVREDELAQITPDTEVSYMAGDRSQDEPIDSRKATVITRLWKCRDKHGNTTVKGVQMCRNVTVRKEWDLGIRLYPLAAFIWQRRKNCAYGESEITNLIPNQIAINRMLTASVWAVMMMGVPMTVVNGDVVTGELTNDPGQVLRVYGTAEDVMSAVRYVEPPQFSPRFNEYIQSLIANTLTQSGANDAALGDMRPENTSAIIAVREAATMPMQTVQNRFYSFVEDVARIWAEFWIAKYGKRSLKMEEEDDVWYMPFDGDRYRDLVVTAKIDVGATGLWSESQAIATLDNLLAVGVITPLQYLKRLPHGVVPNLEGLIREMQEAQGGAMPHDDVETMAIPQSATPPEPFTQEGQEEYGVDMGGVLEMLSPENRELLTQMPREQQEALIRKAMGA